MNISCLKATRFLSLPSIKCTYKKRKYIFVSMYDPACSCWFFLLHHHLIEVVFAFRRSGPEPPGSSSCWWYVLQWSVHRTNYNLFTLRTLKDCLARLFSHLTSCRATYWWLLTLPKRVLKTKHIIRGLHSSPVTSHNQLRAPPVLSAILKYRFSLIS